MADRDRDRFVALAFCRADLLFELDDDLDVVFAAGATPVLLGEAPDALVHRSFLDLVAEDDRLLAREMLDAARTAGRIDDVVVRLNGVGNRRPNVALAGYRVPDFGNHFFLAVKLEPVYQSEPRAPAEIRHDADSGRMDEASFASVAAERALVLLAGLGGPRFVYRIAKDRRVQRRGGERLPVLVVGADDQAEMFIRHCARHAEGRYRVVGIVGKDAGRVGRNIHGVDVLGTVSDVLSVIDRLTARGQAPETVLLSSDLVDGDIVRLLVDTVAERGLTLARLPRLDDFNDVGEVMRLRPIAVEDLLGRPQVTGAGGSIGSELVRQIAALGPARLVLVEASEYALYTIDMEMHERFPSVERRAVIANVRDRETIEALFLAERPELVFHAAALKHVPMVEANPVEGILTNVFGSRNVADACVAAGVRAMVMISTDKAVNPTNVMGASKRLAECWCQAQDLTQTGTCFITVRFGNVLGSTGSVVPRFQAQLAAGGPITVTHPDMVRYFMTIREAVEQVLQASSLGVSHHDQGKIYVLDMGKPVRIVDLARQMIRLAGLRPDDDVKIVFTGLRPGEKMFEEIFHGAEAPVPTQMEGVLLASPRLTDLASLAAQLDVLGRACRDQNSDLAVDIVARLVPEFHHRGAVAA